MNTFLRLQTRVEAALFRGGFLDKRIVRPEPGEHDVLGPCIRVRCASTLGGTFKVGDILVAAGLNVAEGRDRVTVWLKDNP